MRSRVLEDRDLQVIRTYSALLNVRIAIEEAIRQDIGMQQWACALSQASSKQSNDSAFVGKAKALRGAPWPLQICLAFSQLSALFQHGLQFCVESMFHKTFDMGYKGTRRVTHAGDRLRPLSDSHPPGFCEEALTHGFASNP
jgi:hypothetical protein